eukprot:SAG22_NODE_303_length_12721_cov_3.439075_3_plen_446_part_00
MRFYKVHQPEDGGIEGSSEQQACMVDYYGQTGWWRARYIELESALLLTLRSQQDQALVLRTEVAALEADIATLTAQTGGGGSEAEAEAAAAAAAAAAAVPGAVTPAELDQWKQRLPLPPVHRPDGCSTLLGSAADQLAEAVFRLQVCMRFRVQVQHAGGCRRISEFLTCCTLLVLQALSTAASGGGAAQLAEAAAQLSAQLTDGVLRVSGSAGAAATLQLTTEHLWEAVTEADCKAAAREQDAAFEAEAASKVEVELSRLLAAAERRADAAEATAEHWHTCFTEQKLQASMLVAAQAGGGSPHSEDLFSVTESGDGGGGGGGGGDGGKATSPKPAESVRSWRDPAELDVAHVRQLLGESGLTDASTSSSPPSKTASRSKRGRRQKGVAKLPPRDTVLLDELGNLVGKEASPLHGKIPARTYHEAPPERRVPHSGGAYQSYGASAS